MIQEQLTFEVCFQEALLLTVEKWQRGEILGFLDDIAPEEAIEIMTQKCWMTTEKYFRYLHTEGAILIKWLGEIGDYTDSIAIFITDSDMFAMSGLKDNDLQDVQELIASIELEG